MRALRQILLIIITLLAVDVVAADPIYVYTKSDGTIKFTTKKPHRSVQAKVYTGKNAAYSVIGGRRGFGINESRLFENHYKDEIKDISSKLGVSQSLVRAVIHVESAFNPKAKSRKGAMGLMQLMPATAKELGVKEPYNPKDNIKGGTRYLANLIKKYDGDLRLSLAAYNAGAGAVEKYGGIPPYKETQAYVKKVLKLEKKYSS